MSNSFRLATILILATTALAMSAPAHRHAAPHAKVPHSASHGTATRHLNAAPKATPHHNASASHASRRHDVAGVPGGRASALRVGRLHHKSPRSPGPAHTSLPPRAPHQRAVGGVNGVGTRHAGIHVRRPALGSPFHGGPNGGVAGRSFIRPGSPGRFADGAHGHFHGGFVRWFGPVFWPYAYDDIFEYALWPSDYSEYAGAFWIYAYDDMVGGILGPSADPGTGPATDPVTPAASAGRSRAGVRGLEGQSREFAQICGNRTPRLNDWPIERISRTVQTTDAQRRTLEELKTASAQAAKMLAAACPTETPTTPPDRLDAMEKRVESIIQAIAIVRPSFDKLYASLSGDQQARFSKLGAQASSSADQGPAPSPGGNVAEAGPTQNCGQQVGGLTKPSIDRIEAIVRTTGGQRGTLDALKNAAAEAAGILDAACPASLAPTPPERLAAIEQRVKAMRAAIRTQRPALDAFYASLSDAQKARLNNIGRQAARPQGWPPRTDGRSGASRGAAVGNIMPEPPGFQTHASPP